MPIERKLAFSPFLRYVEARANRIDDPVERLRRYMEKAGLWSKSYEETVRSEAKEKVEGAVHEVENFPPPDPLDIFRFTYHELPMDLKEQMESFLSANGGRDLRE